MTDLFISYSSHDRPWAERLYDDVRRRFPTIRIFWDRASILPGADWPAVLQENAKKSKHFLVLWSEKAKESNQVGPEIHAFTQNRDANPRAGGADRELFYIPLEGEYGPLEVKQGFTELRRLQTYSAKDDDRGVRKLDVGPHQAEWRRIVGIIGDTVLAAEETQPINLALLVMNQANVDFVDPFLALRTGPGPTLMEVLDAVGLTLSAVKQRYGTNAFSWQPFGNGRTVIELMEQLREAMNANLNPEYRFHWVPYDLEEIVKGATHEAALRQALESLAERPSAVVIDPISLFNPVVAEYFKRLDVYSKNEHAILISLSPNEMPAADRLYDCLRSKGAPVFDGYFLPQIPATSTFALCGVNVSHVTHAERLIRGSLGFYHPGRRPSRRSASLGRERSHDLYVLLFQGWGWTINGARQPG